MEEEYGRTLQKLARGSSEVYSMSDGKAGCVMDSQLSSGNTLIISTEPLSLPGKRLCESTKPWQRTDYVLRNT